MQSLAAAQVKEIVRWAISELLWWELLRSSDLPSLRQCNAEVNALQDAALAGVVSTNENVDAGEFELGRFDTFEAMEIHFLDQVGGLH